MNLLELLSRFPREGWDSKRKELGCESRFVSLISFSISRQYFMLFPHPSIAIIESNTSNRCSFLPVSTSSPFEIRAFKVAN